MTEETPEQAPKYPGSGLKVDPGTPDAATGQRGAVVPPGAEQGSPAGTPLPDNVEAG